MRGLEHMRVNSRLWVLVLGVCIVGAFVIGSWPSAAPFEVQLAGIESSGLVDDNGTQPQIITLSISNTCGKGVWFAREWIKVEAKLGNRWMTQQNHDGLRYLTTGETKNVMVFLPSEATSCRLHFKYDYSPLFQRIANRIANWVWRAGIRTPVTFNRWIYSFPPPNQCSRTATVEVEIPAAAERSTERQ